MRSWIRKPVGAVLLVALLAVWGLAQAPPPFTGRIKVEISPTGAGNISLNPAGDLYGSIYFYTSPTTVTLTASPNSGYAFVRWEIWSSIPASGDPETRTANPTSITLSTATPDWTVRAVFQEVGSLRVTIQPPEAVAAGAQWKATRNGYDSGWRNSGETLTNLPVGEYTVTFKDIPGWTKPADQTVTITQDTTAEVTGTYVQHTGSLRVTIQPPEAVAAGAQWKATRNGYDSGPWIPGWNSGDPHEPPRGPSLRVTIQPPEAVAAGAQWKATRNGYDSGWRNSGETLTNLPVGEYTVTFKDIPGWTKPADRTVTITKDTTTEVTGTYTIIAVFYEDFEDISGWIRTGLWHTCSDACSWGCQAKLIGKYAHYAKPGTCSYDTGTTTSGTLTSPIISIPKNTTLALQFDYARYVENYTRASRDLTYVQIRLGTDRTWGSWRTIWSRSSRNPSPECGTFTYTFQTRSYTRLQVRFIFNSVNRYNNNFPGWAIDNLIVRVPETAPGALEVTDIGDDVDNIVPETITAYNYPNPVKDVHTTTFVVEGVDAELIRVEVYDLTGKLVWKGEGSGNELTWHTEDLTGLPLANGVYLYKVFVKVDGTWIASDVRKLVILR